LAHEHTRRTNPHIWSTQVKPQEDIYYYRFLLKLSLDPEPNWWAKFHREARAYLSGTVQRPSREPSPTRAATGGINASRQRSGFTATPSGRGTIPVPLTHANQRSSHVHDSIIGSQSQLYGKGPQAFLVGTAPASMQQPVSMQQHTHADPEYYATPSGRPFPKANEPNRRTETRQQISALRGHSFATATSTPKPGDDDGSDWEGSDAEAYIDFQRAAKSFRTWRNNAYVAKESRQVAVCVMSFMELTLHAPLASMYPICNQFVTIIYPSI